jgi:hypothetical protein
MALDLFAWRLCHLFQASDFDGDDHRTSAEFPDVRQSPDLGETRAAESEPVKRIVVKRTDSLGAASTVGANAAEPSSKLGVCMHPQGVTDLSIATTLSRASPSTRSTTLL